MMTSAFAIEVEEDDFESGAGPGVGKGSSQGSKTTLRWAGIGEWPSGVSVDSREN